RAFGTGTILFELFIGAALLTTRYRALAVVLATGFHFGIEAMLSIGSLGYQFIAADLCLFFHPDKALEYQRAIGEFRRRQTDRLLEFWGKLRPAASSDGEAFS